VATIVIAAATIGFQLAGDATYRAGIVGVAVWFSVFVAYFALVGRHRLILSPEEEFAMQRRRAD
jgi:ethanolamine permease